MTIRDRVLDQVRRAYPETVESETVRARYGKAGCVQLARLAAAGEIERVRIGAYRAKEGRR